MIPLKVYEVPEQRKPGQCDYLVPRVVLADLDAADAKCRLFDRLEKSGGDSAMVSRISNAIAAIEDGRPANLHDLKDSGAYTGPELMAALGEEFADLSKSAEDMADGEQVFDPNVRLLVVDDVLSKGRPLREMMIPEGELDEIRSRLRRAVESGDPLVPANASVLLDCGRLPASVVLHLYPGGSLSDFLEFSDGAIVKSDDGDSYRMDRMGSGGGAAGVARDEDRRGSGAGPASTGDDDPEYGGANDQQVTEQEQARDINVRNRRMLISGEGDTADVPSTTELLRMVSPRSPLPCMACGAGLRGLPIIITNQARCRNCATLNPIPPSSQVAAEPRTRRATVPTTTEKSLASAWAGIRALAGVAEPEPAPAPVRRSRIAKSHEPAPRAVAREMTLNEAVAILEAGA